MAHTSDAIVVSCMDFRFQQFIDEWIRKNLGTGNHDRVAFAGGVKEFDIILEQIELSKKLHDIKKVVLINHEDCGGYGAAGTPKIHAKDLKTAARKIQSKYPDMVVQAFYLHLNGTFEEIK